MTPTITDKPQNSENLLRCVADASTRLAQWDECGASIRAQRDIAVRKLIAIHGPSMTARLTGLSLSLVRLIQKGA